jgi:uncharacterized protein (TIGR00255 family)
MQSMTGFGRAEGSVGASQFTVEVKSVNHRYLDARFRLPNSLSLFEPVLGERLRGMFERGSFEITIRHKVTPAGNTMASGTRFVVDKTALESLIQSLKWVEDNYDLNLKLSPELLAQTGRIFVPIDEPETPESLLSGVKPIFEQALTQMAVMRDTEGKKLKSILKDGINSLSQTVEKLASLAPEQPKRIEERLKARVAQWNLTSVDPHRLEMEVALYAERADITEELDRLKTHANAFLKHLDSPRGVGRRLDFLTQEILREVNTLGAKATLIEMTQLTVEAKTAVEKLREQVQNVE